MRIEMVVGLILIFAGVATYMYYDKTVKPDKEAEILLVEGKFIFERGTTEAINEAISIFTKIVAKYPESSSAVEAYFLIAQCYEKLGLHRLAYIKYIYILKNTRNQTQELESEVRARVARLSIMREHTEEGINGLLTVLNNSTDPNFRSRVYTELGHTKLKSGDNKTSLRMFDIALNENGSNEDALLGKALVFKRLGEDNKAYDLYEYFLKFFGPFSSYGQDVRASYLTQVYESGLNAYRKREYSKSIGYFKRLLNYFPVSDRTENTLYWLGENYYALKKYSTALTYFQRVLASGGNAKNEDSRLKSGYCYFMMKRFDLAAREFQLYMKNYPKGRHIVTARRWHDMCIRELEYKFNASRPKVEPEIVEEPDIPDNVDDSDNIINNIVDEDIFDEKVSNSTISKGKDPLKDLIEL